MPSFALAFLALNHAVVLENTEFTQVVAQHVGAQTTLADTSALSQTHAKVELRATVESTLDFALDAGFCVAQAPNNVKERQRCPYCSPGAANRNNFRQR